MVLMAVTCPYWQSEHIAKRGQTAPGQQRYRCHILPGLTPPSYSTPPTQGGYLRSKRSLSPGRSMAVVSGIPHVWWASGPPQA